MGEGIRDRVVNKLGAKRQGAVPFLFFKFNFLI